MKRRSVQRIKRLAALMLSSMLALTGTGLYTAEEYDITDDQTLYVEGLTDEAAADPEEDFLLAGEDLIADTDEDMFGDLPEDVLEEMTEEDLQEELTEDIWEEPAEEAMEEAMGDPLIEEEADDLSGGFLAMADGPQITNVEELQAALDQGGTVALTQDIEGSVTIKTDVTLDLNGFILTGGITVNARRSLTLTDSNPLSPHASLTYKDLFDNTKVYEVTGGAIVGGRVNVGRSGQFNMEAGTITGSGSGAVYVQNGTFVMSGGAIAGNSGWIHQEEQNDGSWEHGGIVDVSGYSGIFTMKGGCITCNSSADFAGGCLIHEGAVFTMENGSITGNKAGRGGGVCVTKAAFTMLNGEISGNRANDGGGVYLEDSYYPLSYTSRESIPSSLDMKGGRIADNIAVNNGGGIHVGNYAVKWSARPEDRGPDVDTYVDVTTNAAACISGGSITGNSAGGNGGGVFVGSCTTFEMSNHASVTNNTAGYNGGGIFASDGKLGLVFADEGFGNPFFHLKRDMKLRDCIISGNTAGEKGEGGKGGGIYLSKIDLSLKYNDPIPSELGEGTLYLPKYTFSVSGTTKISGNGSGQSGALITDNLYIEGEDYVTAEGPLTGSSIGITTSKVPTGAEPLIFTRGLSGNGVATNFFSDNLTYAVKLNTDKEAMLGIFARHNLTVADHKGGSVTASAKGLAESSTGLSDIEPGETITLKVSADSCCSLKKLTFIDVGGVEKEPEPDPDQEGVYTFIMPRVETIVTAVFTTTHTPETVITKATPDKDGASVQKCSGCGKELGRSVIRKASQMKLSASVFTYNGKARTPAVTVADSGGTALPADSYSVAWSDNINAGTATATVTLQGKYYTGTKNLAFTIKKAANPMKAKAKKVSLDGSKLQAANQTVTAKKAFSVTKAKGKVTYKKLSGVKKISVSRSGKITVMKGLPKGTYTVKVKVTAAGNPNYRKKSKTVKLKITVGGSTAEVWKTVANLRRGYLAIRSAPTAEYKNERNHTGLKNGDRVKVTGKYVQGTTFGGRAATYVWVYAPKYNMSGYVNAAYLK